MLRDYSNESALCEEAFLQGDFQIVREIGVKSKQVFCFVVDDNVTVRVSNNRIKSKVVIPFTCRAFTLILKAMNCLVKISSTISNCPFL